MWTFVNGLGVWGTICMINLLIFSLLAIFNRYKDYISTKEEKERKRKEQLEVILMQLRIKEEEKKLEKQKQKNRITPNTESYSEPFDDFDHGFLDDEDDGYRYMDMF